MKETANRGGLRVRPQAYFSAAVLVKFPSLPLSLIWLSPNETMDPALARTPVPLPPIVDAATLMAEPAVLV
jgi:hypothetical protein